VDVFVVGTSHSLAPAAVRERLHVDVDEIYGAIDELLAQGVLSEALPLATCARLELYGVANEPERAARLLVRGLSNRVGVARSDLDDRLYTLHGATAVRHLYRVASGLDSVVHGEAQVLGQVRDAAGHPRAAQTKGKVLHRLFDTALATGKRVRAETDIGRGAASLASAAIALVRGRIGRMDSVSALVLGAGDTGSLVARLLRKEGVGRLVIANRTIETAREIAAEVGGEGISLSDLEAHLPDADLVVGAVTAGESLIDAGSLLDRERRPRYFLDLGHPRNFDPGLADVSGVELFDLEHVFERVQAAQDARASQVPLAEAIVKEQAATFGRWLRSRESVEVLKAVRQQVLAVARSEADRFAQGRSDEEREQMMRLARSLARTLLHPPTVALRDTDPSSDEGRSLLSAAPALFGVDVEGRDSSESC
jgi:glutamyl-tRNA reductase